MKTQPLMKKISEEKRIKDPWKLVDKILPYEDRIIAPQIKTNYGLFIFEQEVIQLTKKTKKKSGLTKKSYTPVSRKGYKNLEWLDRMYKRRTLQSNTEEENNKKFKVIIPLKLPYGYKIYDNKGKYYATVIEEDDLFCYIAIGKNNDEIHYFLRTYIEKFYIEGQCEGKYGFTVPLEFVKNYERPG